MNELKSLPSPHQSPTSLHHDHRHEKILRMLKHSVLTKLSSNTNPPVYGATSVEEIIQQVFPQSFHIPTHPTYASMILRAIDELKEEQGSSEGAISAFIKREYNDLPWGHETFLSHHLRKLCGNGGIKCTRAGRYMLENMFEGENAEELQQSEVCKKLLEDRWKLKQGPRSESKSDTWMTEGQLCQRREDSADEKQRQQEQIIDVRARTIDSCYDNVKGLNVPLLATVSPLPVMIEKKVRRLKWENDAIRKDRLEQVQQMDVKPQISPSFQDDEEKGLSLNIPQEALASSPPLQQENLEQSQLKQPHCPDHGSVLPALNQLQQMHDCSRNESNLCQNDLSAFSELHVDAEEVKYSSCKILPKQETELNLNAIASYSSNAEQHLGQQPPKHGQGRPRKLISDGDTTSVGSWQSYHYKFYNHEESRLLQCRGLGRPLEEPTVVPSHSYHYKFYSLEETQLRQPPGQGRPRELFSNVGKTTVVSSQSYHYKFYNHEETQLRQSPGRGRHCEIKTAPDESPEAMKLRSSKNENSIGGYIKSVAESSAEDLHPRKPIAFMLKESLEGGTDDNYIVIF